MEGHSNQRPYVNVPFARVVYNPLSMCVLVSLPGCEVDSHGRARDDGRRPAAGVPRALCDDRHQHCTCILSVVIRSEVSHPTNVRDTSGQRLVRGRRPALTLT